MALTHSRSRLYVNLVWVGSTKICCGHFNLNRNCIVLLLYNIKMSAYTSEYPPVDFDEAYKKFFEEFYATSDTPDAHEKYAENFTKDATLVMASKKAHGSDGTLH